MDISKFLNTKANNSLVSIRDNPSVSLDMRKLKCVSRKAYTSGNPDFGRRITAHLPHNDTTTWSVVGYNNFRIVSEFNKNLQNDFPLFRSAELEISGSRIDKLYYFQFPYLNHNVDAKYSYGYWTNDSNKNTYVMPLPFYLMNTESLLYKTLFHEIRINLDFFRFDDISSYITSYTNEDIQFDSWLEFDEYSMPIEEYNATIQPLLDNNSLTNIFVQTQFGGDEEISHMYNKIRLRFNLPSFGIFFTFIDDKHRSATDRPFESITILLNCQDYVEYTYDNIEQPIPGYFFIPFVTNYTNYSKKYNYPVENCIDLSAVEYIQMNFNRSTSNKYNLAVICHNYNYLTTATATATVGSGLGFAG